ncbi:MAG: ATP-binding cassette domain-containing protein, partial [Streptosporangiaceae bacterium]
MTGRWPQAAGPSHPLLHLLPAIGPALIPVLVLLLGLDVYCLVSLVRARSVRNAPKLAWAIVILFVSAPLGAILYLFFGMDRSGGGQTGLARRPAASKPAPPVRAAREPDGTRAILTVAGLTRDYGGIGLFDVDLAVPRGSVYGLVGPNGAGKTTLLSIIAGTRHADSGTVSLAADRRRVAVCPDVPEFDGWLTAAEVVDLARA